MLFQIDVRLKRGTKDVFGEGIKKDIEDLGIEGVDSVEVIKVYRIEGKITQKEIEKISQSILTDPTIEEYSFRPSKIIPKNSSLIEVAYNPGVMDPVEESAKKAIKDLGILEVDSLRTARKYIIRGRTKPVDLELICEKILANKVIQHIVQKKEAAVLPSTDYEFALKHINLLEANDKEMLRISRQGVLNLNLMEMKKVRDYFAQLGRNPTDIELETIAQTWSEHCLHKTFKGIIDYKGERIDNLLKSTVMRVTSELKKLWCVSVFKDNSGIIEFNEDFNVCFKVETHNHPSAIEPYGGAGTGIGGVIRDVLGAGLGGKPILNTDVFAVGPPDLSYKKLPEGVIHPKRVLKGVVAGVRDYGNRMGIPTANGAVFFDEGYIGNPLVYCGTVGIIPRDKCEKEVRPGDLIVLVGGRTGRDGIHGVTFASAELTKESEQISGGSVQIGNAITEKKMTDVLLQARDEGLYKAITDCGGGGLSSAVGEMGESTGARVNLEKIPLKYRGLNYTEIWISEAQERMIISVPPENLKRLKEIFSREDVELTVIGEFTGDKRLSLFYEGKKVADLEMNFLHHGWPRPIKKAVWKKPQYKEPQFRESENLTLVLKKILSSFNVCSKEWIIRQYDHEVQGGSVIKPLVGLNQDGPSDACVVKPLLDSKKGIIVSCGMNPKYGLIDPYHMAASAIDEALRQIISVGGNLKRVALLDNFCWGDPDKPDRLGSLVRAAKACYDMARVYGTPFISGKDSLYNEYKIGRRSVSILPSLLISALGVIDDVKKAISMDLKKPGNLIYVVGLTKDELGGSQYWNLKGFMGNRVPEVNPLQGKKVMDSLSRATRLSLLESCHDCSEGGLGVALAEMAFSGGLGMEVFLAEIPREKAIKRNNHLLFSESNSRFVVEVEPRNQRKFEQVIKDIPHGLLGKVTGKPVFKVYGLDRGIVIQAKINDLKESWQKPLRW